MRQSQYKLPVQKLLLIDIFQNHIFGLYNIHPEKLGTERKNYLNLSPVPNSS